MPKKENSKVHSRDQLIENLIQLSEELSADSQKKEEVSKESENHTAYKPKH
jgi:hypothetical protein